MPKFVIDEDMPRSTAFILRKNNYEVDDIRDHDLRGADDGEIFVFAQKQKSVIISGDRGFGNLLRFPLASHYGIVIAHFSNETSTEVINTILIKKLGELTDDDFKGNLIIVDENKIRIRRKF